VSWSPGLPAISPLVIVARLIALLSSAAPEALNGDRFTVILGFRLSSKTTLADVQRRLGDAPLTSVGETGELRYSVCYFLPRISAVIQFESGVIGGPEHQLQGYTVFKAMVPEGACRKLGLEGERKVSRGIRGLRLGMNRLEFARLTGVDAKAGPDSLEKFWSARRGYTREESEQENMRGPTSWGADSLDVQTYVAGWFKHDTLVKFSVWKVETN
jgi:hypothetical protein